MFTGDEELREALRAAASALKAAGHGFALAGSYALWVHGAPEPVHDVDLVIAESDADAVAATLADAGFEIERPPEDWLFKAHRGDAVVDLLHRLNGDVVDADTLAAARPLDVLAINMPVLSATDVLTQKLLSMHEHHCNFGPLLPGARAVREQVDWAAVRKHTAHNDFAVAFLVLADRLGIITADGH